MIYTEPAYAKLNLTLDILNKRSDGYHNIKSVMQSINLIDEISVSPCDKNGFYVNSDLLYLPKDETNIAIKAAIHFFEKVGLEAAGIDVDIEKRIKEESNIPTKAMIHFFNQTGIDAAGLDINIKKRIPICAGMAGGSSDGAAVLRILRRVYAPEMPQDWLEEIGALVGSDIPYCIRGGTVLAEGRGDILTNLSSLPPCHIVVCKPRCSISTPELFSLVRVKKLRHHPRTEELRAALDCGDLRGVTQRLYNVFEEVLPRRFAPVFEIKSRLLDLGAMAASMTGSGPSVFGIFRDGEPARAAAEALREQFPQTFLCRPAGRAL